MSLPKKACGKQNGANFSRVNPDNPRNPRLFSVKSIINRKDARNAKGEKKRFILALFASLRFNFWAKPVELPAN